MTREYQTVDVYVNETTEDEFQLEEIYLNEDQGGAPPSFAGSNLILGGGVL